MSDNLIHNESNLRQIVDFNGLRYGPISPTDIDAQLEFDNRLFIFIEAKFGDAKVPIGQRLALERMCDAIHAPPHRYAVVLVASHQTEKGKNIDLGAAKLTAYRYGGKWKNATDDTATVRSSVDFFINKVMGEGP